ncbi:ADAM metallopeptidase domain 2 [Phyllostomus discolor]|uniref:Disintegrin and metalloproteinase domain-containing protein 2 n=1 Tax=Phyllostomus discolor TaxID=89673 RepID=A0A834DMW9_9CHIR|nr:ADAM metallopeptidase domain 2 [Phyllostomus discolor]
MLCFPFLFIGLIGLQTTDSEVLRVQITIPEKVQPVSREGVQSNVSYNIVIDGQTYTMNLMQKAFLPHNFRVYGYNGTGHMKPFEQEIQNFCYYQGYIEGYPDSMVILSTCTGLRGLLQFENVSYGIEPLEPSFGFEHVIYQVQHKNEGASLYAEDIKPREMPYKIQSIEHPKIISMESFSVIIAQLLSLSMGIAYDDLDKCQCPGAVCIMNPEAIHSSGVKFFSNCSMEDFAHFISKPKAHCLQNHPRLDPTYKAAICGNRVVEEGEACDCGTTDECDADVNSCCESTGCTLKSTSQCNTGLCCDNCQFKPKGEQCRSSGDECDLPEYCNGTSASCQDNFYVQDGHPCGNSQWLCVHGNCMSMDKQCRDLFGEDISGAPQECFEYLNSMADESGNCGTSGSGYKKCESNATTTYTNVNGKICLSVEYPTGNANIENMWVKDGTVCGQDQVCKNKECGSNYLGYDCTPQKCSSNGVCNNAKNCHCSPGYLPPNCNTHKDSWPGGSINSGNFPPAESRNPERHYIKNAYPSRPTRWPFFLLIPFAIILSVMIVTLVKVYLQRKKWKTEEYTSDEEIESETETNE